MDLFLSIFTPIVSCVSNYAVMTYFFGAMSQGKRRNVLSAVSVISFLTFIFTMFFIKEPIVRLLLMTLATFSYTYLFSYKFYNRIFITVAYIALSCVGENVTNYLFLLFYGVNFYMDNSGPVFLFATVAAKLLGFVIIYIVAVSKRQLTNGFFRWSLMSLLSLPFSTTLASVTMYYVLLDYTPAAKLSVMGLVSMILLIASNLFVFRIVDKMRRDAEYESRIEYATQLVKKQTEQYDALFRSGREVYKIQHDNKNFLLGAVSELKAGNNEKALAMLEERIESFSNRESGALTGNSIVDTVLNYKFSEARENGIKVEFEHKNAGEIKISGIDFAVLCGNAVDNAAEAVKSLSQEEKVIDVVIVVINDRINISIKNRVKENINALGLKTGKNNADKHGFGIINMKSIAAKYNGEVVLDCKDKVFSTVIMVDNKEQ